MFSGIIDKLAPVNAVRRAGDTLVLNVQTGYVDAVLGESIAVNGVCLTVAKLAKNGDADFFVSQETLQRTNLGTLGEKFSVNLERSVKLETRLSGHLVQAHVDGKAVLSFAAPEEETHRLVFSLPSDLGRFCVEKGSIALNGISLTINAVRQMENGDTAVDVTIIPHTWEHTNLHTLKSGDAVNVEIDVIAKYVERLCQPYLTP